MTGLEIPTGFRPPAQGCPPRGKPPLGKTIGMFFQPQRGLRPVPPVDPIAPSSGVRLKPPVVLGTARKAAEDSRTPKPGGIRCGSDFAKRLGVRLSSAAFLAVPNIEAVPVAASCASLIDAVWVSPAPSGGENKGTIGRLCRQFRSAYGGTSLDDRTRRGMFDQLVVAVGINAEKRCQSRHTSTLSTPINELARPERWSRLWQAISAEGDGSVWYQALTRAYAEPHRHYHNQQHIADCLTEFDPVRHCCPRGRGHSVCS